MTQITPEQLAEKMARKAIGGIYGFYDDKKKKAAIDKYLFLAKLAISELTPKISDDVKGAIEREYPMPEQSQLGSEVCEMVRNAAEQWYILGVQNSREKWISIDDASNPMPPNTDFLVLFEDGSVIRHYEDYPALIATHWQPLPTPPNDLFTQK